MDVDDPQTSGKIGWDKQETTLLLYDQQETEDGDKPYVDGPLVRSEFDLPQGPLLRFKAYGNAWDRCLHRVKQIVHRLQIHVVDDIIQTIQHSYEDTPEDIVLPASELVIQIVSSSDRTYVHECFGRVLETLEEGEDAASQDNSEAETVPLALVSRISEIDCQNLTSMLKALISGFVTQPLGIKGMKKTKVSSTLANYDMYILRAWYQAVQRHYGDSTPALMVMIQDIHLVDPTHLQDLFEICSCHVPHVPISFLLGTSDPNHLHSSLPRSTLACLRLHRHSLPQDVKILEKLIRETFFDLTFTPGVMIGPAGYVMIFNEFKRHNSTLDGLLSTLQLLHMQHFYNPLAFMGNPEYDSMINDVLDDPSEAQRQFFQLLRQHSISTRMATGSAMDQLEWSNLTPRDVINIMKEARETFQKRFARIKVALHILETIIAFAQEHGLKVTDTSLTSFETMGLEALRGTLGILAAQSTCSLMRQLKPIEIQALLETLFHFVHNLPSNVRILETKLKPELVIAKHKINEETLDRFFDFLTRYFKETLIPVDDIAFIDVWWTGEIGIPNSPFNPNPHISIVTSLLEPHEYLGLDESRERCAERTYSPDVTILFRRYVESGKLINIYDWYESFSMALEDRGGDEDKGEDKGEDEDGMAVNETPSKRKTRGNGTSQGTGKIENRISPVDGRKREFQARFMRAIHELEFVGFLKHTGRKADHVLKTVFDIID